MSIEPAGVVREVMRYFLQNPHAIDSLEGIARWRLLQMEARDIVGETDAALTQLVDRGLIEEISVASGPALYRLNGERAEAARQLLEETT